MKRQGPITMTRRSTTSTRRPTVPRNFTIALAAILTLNIFACMTHSPRAYSEGRLWVANAAHVLNATDTAHLHYIRSSGSLLFEE
jgi:hypothetical protein